MIISAAEEMNPTRRSTPPRTLTKLTLGIVVMTICRSWVSVYDGHGHGGRDMVDFLELRQFGKNENDCAGASLRQDDNASILEKIELGFLNVHGRFGSVL